MGFTEIKTQEEFDEAIKDRLKRERESVESKFSDYEKLKANNEALNKQVTSLTEELNTKKSAYGDLEKKFNESAGKIAEYETNSVKMRAAVSAGLPLEMVDRIKGSTKEEIEADVSGLAKLVKTGRTQPGFQANEHVGDSKEEAYRKMAESFENE